MSKAEDFAYQKYPQSKKGVLYDLARNSIIQGYHQAEEDLALTWEDLATIEKLGDDFVKQNHTTMSDEEFYKEVLKRFKDLKEK